MLFEFFLGRMQCAKIRFFNDYCMNLEKALLSALIIPLALKISMPPSSLNPADGDKANDNYLTSATDVSKIVLFHIFAYTFLAAYFYLYSNSPFYQSGLVLYEYIALFLGFSGAFLRIWSYRTLGNFFTFQIGIRNKHILIQNGPYTYLMHPSYTGAFFGHAGFIWFLGFRQPLFFGAFLLLFARMLYLRIVDEEKLLQRHFGSIQWAYYAANRWRLIPLIY
jgi:protein-S-isoprenylcysteine O-methyltransferase Ste14